MRSLCETPHSSFLIWTGASTSEIVLTFLQQIIFDPIPRVEGVESSEDPLLEDRANVYLISGKERREA